MSDLFRETPLGQLIRLLSRNRLLRYPEEQPYYELPPQYVAVLRGDEKPSQGRGADESSDEAGDTAISPGSERAEPPERDMHMLATIDSVASVRTNPYTSERFQAELDQLKTRSMLAACSELETLFLQPP